MTLSRMVHKHGLQLKEDEAHKILKYLADNYGLAPAEVIPFEYVLEERNSTLEGKDKAGLPPNVTGACVQCHSFARIGLQRRTPEMWKRLPDLHEYFVPFVASDTSSAGNLIEPWRQVATKEAVPYFIKRFPFETLAWTQWQAAAKPDYSGKWLVVGHDPAKGGDYTGTLTVTSSGDDQYRGKFTHDFEDGTSVSGATEAVLYAKFQWRGRAQVGDPTIAPVIAEAVAVCTPSDDSGSINSPASPKSRKRSPANWRAVYSVASETRGVAGRLAAETNFET